MFNGDFVTAKQVHDRNVREAERRQSTYRLSRELREQALAAARAANGKQPLLSRIAGWLNIKRESQDSNDVTRAHTV